MIDFFIRNIGKVWGPDELHASADLSFARQQYASWFNINPMLYWNAAIATRVMPELSKEPIRRSYHRYLPFPRSLTTKFDKFNDVHLVKLALHHQLLTGVVLYIDPSDVPTDELEPLSYCAIHKKAVIYTHHQYESKMPGYSRIKATEDISHVKGAFDQLWETFFANKNLYRLYYRIPQTFNCDKSYFPNGLREFLRFLQQGKCPCGCSMHSGDEHIDHIIPKNDGGTNVLINLQITCSKYNSEIKKGDRDPRQIEYGKILKNKAPNAGIPFDYIEMLLDPKLNERGVLKISKRLSSYFKGVYRGAL